MTSSESTRDIVLDLRGLVCPDPLTRTIDALSKCGPDQRVVAEIDFSPAVLTLSSITQRQPWDLTIQGIAEGKEWRLTFVPRGKGFI
jgi:TusA-related sulfurtransferase